MKTKKCQEIRIGMSMSRWLARLLAMLPHAPPDLARPHLERPRNLVCELRRNPKSKASLLDLLTVPQSTTEVTPGPPRTESHGPLALKMVFVVDLSL